MKFLKGFGTFILSFLLFLSLTLFSIAFLVQCTALSPDFVTKQVNKVDIPAAAREITEEQLAGQLPEEADFLKEVALDVIALQEPWIKEQLDNSIDTVYDYFLSRTDALHVSVSLADIKATLDDTLWQAAKDYLREQLSGKSDTQISQYLLNIIAQFPRESLSPELAAVSDAQFNAYAEQFLREFSGLAVSSPLTAQVEVALKQYFDGYIADFVNQIDDEYTLDQSSIDPETMATFETVRKYIGYFRAAFYWLIVAMVVFGALIFLINRNVKVTCRALGIDLLIFGAFDLAGVLFMRSLNPLQYVTEVSLLPASLEIWFQGVFKDVLFISQAFSIGVLVLGVILIVVSIFVKHRTDEDITPADTD